MTTRGRAGSVRRRLLEWFDAHRRPLPWRDVDDPYKTWVSEVMLQQTRVETVIPYYTRFLERFPTLAVLADAPEDAVMAAWSGLGYYRRARMLHEGARTCVRDHAGEVPADRDARLALPGVGRYTAGAIGSIAFGLEEPLVDGNVARVLSRLHAIDAPLGTRASEEALYARAGELVRGQRPGDLNQALMELGATVCTPAPDCARCPIRSTCAARVQGSVERFPAPKARRAPREVALVALVATSGDEVLLERARGDLFGGLHNVPTREGRGRPDAVALARSLGVAGRGLSRAGELVHVLSHRRLQVEVYRATVAAWSATARRRRLVPLDELARVGTSTLTRRVLAVAGVR